MPKPTLLLGDSNPNNSNVLRIQKGTVGGIEFTIENGEGKALTIALDYDDGATIAHFMRQWVTL